MDLAIDIGNSAIKAALFPGHDATEGATKAREAGRRELQIREPLHTTRIPGHDLHALHDFVAGTDIRYAAVATTVRLTAGMTRALESLATVRTMFLDATTPIPILNRYATPATLGADRLAAAVGAYYAARRIHGTAHVPVLIIDSGTAITYDFVTAGGEFLGGNISPGIHTRFRALHEFTSQLPLIAPPDRPLPPHTLSLGNSTQTAIASGVMEGVRLEIEGYIRHFVLKYPNVLIFLTGGDSFHFDETLKKRIFAENFLVLQGLDIINRYTTENE